MEQNQKFLFKNIFKKSVASGSSVSRTTWPRAGCSSSSTSKLGSSAATGQAKCPYGANVVAGAVINPSKVDKFQVPNQWFLVMISHTRKCQRLKRIFKLLQIIPTSIFMSFFFLQNLKWLRHEQRRVSFSPTVAIALVHLGIYLLQRK